MNQPKKRAQPLTRTEVLKAALEIIDAEGLGALTMRRLATEVGVEAMSLYHHMPNKEALLDGVVERVLAEMRVPETWPDDWMDLMEDMLSEFRRVLVDHPGVLPLVADRPPATEASAPYMRIPLQVLSQAGLSAEDAVALYQSVVAFTFGHALLSARSGPAFQAGEAAAGDLAAQIAQWDESTFRRGIRALLEAYGG